MRILLTNDDGLRAPGIQALYEALVDAHGDFRESGGARGEVTAIAPLTVQSATSHGVTFHEPLMVREDRLGWGGVEEVGLVCAGDLADPREARLGVGQARGWRCRGGWAGWRSTHC